MKTRKTILSLLLVYALAASIGGVQVLADDDQNQNGIANDQAMPYTVAVTSNDNTGTAARFGDEIVPDIKVVDNGHKVDSYNGVDVTYTEPGNVPTITVNGPIETEVGSGLTVTNTNSNTPIAVVVNGGVKAPDTDVVFAETANPTTSGTTIDIYGDVVAPNDPNSDGIIAVEDINSTVNVHGSVENNSWLDTVVATGNSAKVTVDENVTANGDGTTAVNVSNGATVEVKGSIESNGTDGTGVNAGNDAAVEVKGNVTAKGTGVDA